MVMEDSDRLSIPQRLRRSRWWRCLHPGSFIYEARNTAGAYLEVAGKGKPQSDIHHAFVLRANGVVVAANNVNGVFKGLNLTASGCIPGIRLSSLISSDRSFCPGPAAMDADHFATGHNGGGLGIIAP